MTRDKYEKKFSEYRDVLTLSDFMKMFGIGDSYARKLMRENHVRHFYISHKYYIPKVWAIDYIFSDHYQSTKHRLGTQI